MKYSFFVSALLAICLFTGCNKGQVSIEIPENPTPERGTPKSEAPTPDEAPVVVSPARMPAPSLAPEPALHSKVAMPTPVPSSSDVEQTPKASSLDYGIRFTCEPSALKDLKEKMEEYLQKNDIGSDIISISESGSSIEYKLKSDSDDTDTLELGQKSHLGIQDDLFITPDGGTQSLVSVKEILLAMMQRGRLFELKESRCVFQNVVDHVEMRRNISKFAATALWSFPEGVPSYTNPSFWNGFSVRSGISASDAVADAWNPNQHYLMGCTNSCRLIVAQGVLDYLKNIKKETDTVQALDEYVGDDPLGYAEPSVRGTRIRREGAYVTRYFNIPWNNWIPGDWGYIRNDDDESASEGGYEGCNIVYIGRGLFAVYYDNDPDRTLRQAVLRVYRWRKSEKRLNVSNDELFAITRQDPYSGSGGGLLRDVRDVPRFFEKLAP